MLSVPAPIDHRARAHSSFEGNLADPVPRPQPLAVTPVQWPVVRRIALPRLAPPIAADFSEIVAERRSRRSIDRAPLREVLNCLSFATFPSSKWSSAGQLRTHRPAHSAGGLHPAEIALVTGRRRRRIFRLDANEAVLELLHSNRPEALSKLDAKITEVFPHSECDYLVMLADSTAVDAFYTNAESLLWRDAGALMATLHLCATAYRLAFCPAGILGLELIHALFGADPRVRALGAAVIGRPKASRSGVPQ